MKRLFREKGFNTEETDAEEEMQNPKLRLDGVYSLREVLLLLLLLLGLLRGLVLGEASPDGTGLLWSEVQRDVLLLLIEQAQLVSLGGVQDGHHTSNRLADIVDLGEFRAGATGNLLHSQSGKLGLQLIELLGQVGLGLVPQLGG